MTGDPDDLRRCADLACAALPETAGLMREAAERIERAEAVLRHVCRWAEVHHEAGVDAVLRPGSSLMRAIEDAVDATTPPNRDTEEGEP